MHSILAGIALTLIGPVGDRPGTPPSVPTSTYLIIYTHPDDEASSAAFLAKECNRPLVDCHFIYTKAKSTVNYRGGQCMYCAHDSPPALDCGNNNDSLPGIRSNELQASLDVLFDPQSLAELALPNDDADPFDGEASVASILAEWDDAFAIGGVATLLKSHIEALDPDKVFTHDPRHGTTCHGEHMATATAVRDAIDLMIDDPPLLFFNETFIHDSTGPGPANPPDEALWYDTWSGSLSVLNPFGSGTVAAREYFRYVLEIHMSQFAPDFASCIPPSCPIGTPCQINVEDLTTGPDSFYTSRFALAADVDGIAAYGELCLPSS